MAALSLWLDSYDDIYSDFDSRHYLKRRISEDFIDELKASLKYRTEHHDALLLLLPAHLRNQEIEKEIAVSIREQMNSRLQALNDKLNAIRRRGIFMLLLGVLFMVTDAIIVYRAYTAYFIIVLRIIMEPAGWFLIWNGLDFLIYNYRATKKEIFFYKTITQLSLHFKDI